MARRLIVGVLGLLFSQTIGWTHEEQASKLARIEIEAARTELRVGEPISFTMKMSFCTAPGEKQKIELIGGELVATVVGSLQVYLARKGEDARSYPMFNCCPTDPTGFERLPIDDTGTATIALSLVALRVGTVPNRPNVPSFAPLLAFPGEFVLTIQQQSTGNRSNSIEFHVIPLQAGEEETLVLATSSQYVRLMMTPRHLRIFPEAEQTANRLVTEYAHTRFASYAKMLLYLARYYRSFDDPSYARDDKQQVAAECVEQLPPVLDEVPTDSPLVQRALHVLYECNSILGRELQADQHWKKLRESYPDSALLPQSGQ